MASAEGRTESLRHQLEAQLTDPAASRPKSQIVVKLDIDEDDEFLPIRRKATASVSASSSSSSESEAEDKAPPQDFGRGGAMAQYTMGPEHMTMAASSQKYFRTGMSMSLGLNKEWPHYVQHCPLHQLTSIRFFWVSYYPPNLLSFRHLHFVLSATCTSLLVMNTDDHSHYLGKKFRVL